MSITLLEFAKSFVAQRLSADVFSEAYIELWKIEGDRGILLGDAPALSECLSSVFCAADMYVADEELREDYELSDEQLRVEVKKLIQDLKFY
ncbi:colicin immunity domain-containing protein [Pseudomonas citronellolis]|uniref:colicin immunity domain-containing protein n=1 Tax=Pseudomonas citronellolis TaxID=53408 RepID=UPI0022BA474B|nr:colicin immunity domain-containing protein [Pseudomonas citronellolis]WBG65026.1 colicin immunity protein [Pseudomonas citronellolis]